MKNIKYQLVKHLTFAPMVFTALAACTKTSSNEVTKKPNIIFVFADQWRGQDIGYMGNTQVKTPHLDNLARQSVIFRNAISNVPVSSPARASLMTGQYPLTHGVFYNDKPLPSEATCIAEVFKENGYQTAYIGKWHINGGGIKNRNQPVPKECRQGFDFWKVHECTHDYNNSFYFDENNRLHKWEGYDAIAQTNEAINYIKTHKNNPFLLFLSWGPPHEPYNTAPPEFKRIYKDSKIALRPNVPDSMKVKATEWLKGYYAHITALDDCIGKLQQAIRETGMEENTIFVFTSDHGDMLGSHGEEKKQKPWEESIAIPFLLKYPAKLKGGEIKKVFSFPDIMPTLLGLSNLEIPSSVEGIDFSGELFGTENLEIDGAYIACPVPFHQWPYEKGGREYRGIRTERYTYVKDLNGPWLLYDNQNDPYQMNNLCNKPQYAKLQAELEQKLRNLLRQRKDEFLKGEKYMKMWNYSWD